MELEEFQSCSPKLLTCPRRLESLSCTVRLRLPKKSLMTVPKNACIGNGDVASD